jgi:hypothetical protein
LGVGVNVDFKNHYLVTFSEDKNKDILEELYILAKHDVNIKRVLDYYKLEIRYTYPELVENLSEILMTITKSLLDQNKSLKQTLKSTIEQSEKPIWFK